MNRPFHLVPILGLALLAACAPEPDNPAPVPTSSADDAREVADARVPGGEPIMAIGDLVGEYRVAGVDDAELPGGEAIALSIDGPLLSYEPTCAGFVWQLAFEGETLRTSRKGNAQDRAPGEPPPPVCAVAVSEGQSALARALDAATRAERTPDNAIRLSGGGHSVTLFSQ